MKNNSFVGGERDGGGRWEGDAGGQWEGMREGRGRV